MELLSMTLMLVVQLSLTIRTRQRQCRGSCHPRRMISPFNMTSQLVALKNTLQPGSHTTAMDRRLLVRPGRLWAIQASGGNLHRRRSTAWVVCILLLPCWMMVMVLELVAADIFVEGVMRCLEAAVSINAVEDRSGGFAQLE